MESGQSGGRTAPEEEPLWEYHLRKYLMLLATLVATATYAAGLSPPGGVREETNGREQQQQAGVPVLFHSARYLAFYYFNATAFMASIVVNLLLLVLSPKGSKTAWLAVLRFVLVLDLLALMGAYATGSCRDLPTTVYASTLVVALASYVGIHILLACYNNDNNNKNAPPSTSHADGDDEEEEASSCRLKEERKVLLLLATFATGVSFGAGLSPPGGFDDAGDPALRQAPRLMAFFYCNTTAFVASLFAIVLLLGRRLQRLHAQVQLYGFILVALLGLLGAYAAGSSREADTMAYILALAAAVPAYIFLAAVLMLLVSDPLKKSSASRWLQRTGCHQSQGLPTNSNPDLSSAGGNEADNNNNNNNNNNENEGIEKAKSLILLLATLAATITYQAGMDPPGGVWPANEHHYNYKAGEPILAWKHAARYRVFFYCNSMAFVASLVVILMVQIKSLVSRHALEVAMILDLFGLIGAYAAGSCRDVSTSIYVMALAGAVLVYVVIHVVFFTLDTQDQIDERDKRKIHKRRKRLLLLAILVATITYQAGLTPPGGFWTHSAHGEPGSPILQDQKGEYQRRYKAFFYCNSTSFMASLALIIILVNPIMYRPGIKCYALYVCMMVALFGLMGAYAAGSARELRTSIYVFVLVGAVLAFIVLQLLVFFKFCANPNGDSSGPASSNKANQSSSSSSSQRGGQAGSPKPSGSTDQESSRRHKYLMLLAILAASVTYQAGLKPPGGTWQESLPGEYAQGDPVMHYTNKARYHAFFYCNSTSFVASVVVIVLLLQESLQNHKWLLRAMNTAIVLDLLGLLGAYAAGSSRDWDTSGYVIALVAVVVAYIAIHTLSLSWGPCRKI